jgi:hypothetical protein
MHRFVCFGLATGAATAVAAYAWYRRGSESAVIDGIVREAAVDPTLEVPEQEPAVEIPAEPVAQVDEAMKKAEEKRLRQERERILYDKWLAHKNEAQVEQAVPGNDSEEEEELLDMKTRSILVKLRNEAHFPLKIERCVSSDHVNSVYYATGENDFQFAIKVNHDGKSTMKKKFKALVDMEKSGLGKCPSPVLYRGHVLVTKWMDEYSFESSAEEHVQEVVKKPVPRRGLSAAEKKAQKKATKLAQAQNRKDAYLNEFHLRVTSQRKQISKRLYQKTNDDDGADASGRFRVM